MIPRIPLAAAAALTLAFVLVGCASTPESVETPTPTPTEAAPTATAAPEEPVAAEEPAADPTCETIVSETTVTALTDLGWTYEMQEFRIGAEVVEGGIQCVWGDYTVASDHVQIYGWAPLDAAASGAAQEALLAEGWQRVEGTDATYITENPQFALATDDEGFGMTYQFGDGWVTLADTKQSLILIDWP